MYLMDKVKDLQAKYAAVVAELEELQNSLPKLKAEAIREIGGLVHDGQVKVTVMQVPYTVDWVDAVEWFDGVANDIERGES